MRICVVSDGRRGIENQALGLAEAVSRLREPEPTRIDTHVLSGKASFSALPPSLQLIGKSDYGIPEDADLVIGCGRQAVAPLIALQRKGSAAFTVYVQDPRTEPSRFDLVVAPEHDGLTGPFVESMIGSPNRVTNEAVIIGTLSHADRLAAMSMPRAAFLVGGNSKTHSLSVARTAEHIAHARRLLDQGYTLLVTTSRRTPDAAVEAWEALATGRSDIWLHTADSESENPYFAFLGGGDILLVSEDSTNMLTEACSTGKPVYRLAMDGKPGKFTALYDRLRERCGVRVFDGGLAAEPYEPLLETDRIAARILDRMAARQTP